MNKEILELIEPYMKKDLSFGCWINFNKDNYQLMFIDDGSCYDKGTLYLSANGGKNEINTFRYKYKILGHYDITAVLKYIDSKAIIEWNASVEVYENTEDGYYIGNILLKPLNLYTEQEEISLLNLLLKLK